MEEHILRIAEIMQFTSWKDLPYGIAIFLTAFNVVTVIDILTDNKIFRTATAFRQSYTNDKQPGRIYEVKHNKKHIFFHLLFVFLPQTALMFFLISLVAPLFGVILSIIIPFLISSQLGRVIKKADSSFRYQKVENTSVLR